MVKLKDWRRTLRNILGPIVLALILAAAFAVVIFGYTAFEYEAEWRAEQEDFENLVADVDFEKQRLKTSSDSAQTYTSKYSLGTDDVYAIISGFLNKTLLRAPTYTFMWSKSLTFVRMYEHAFMLDDDSTLKFNKPSTQIIDIVFRSILPIFSTLAVGCSVSAIHSVVTTALKVCMPYKKHDPWTAGRNKLLRVKVMVGMITSLIYFAVCFAMTTIAASRWQDVSYGDGIKITLNLIATIPPNVQQKSSIDAHTLTALTFVIHSGTAYVIFSLIQLIKTWRVSQFSIPLTAEIDQADRVDKDVQVQYRMQRDELFQQGKKTGEKKAD